MENEEVENGDVAGEETKEKSGCLKYFMYFIAICVVLGFIGGFLDDSKDSSNSSSGDKPTVSYEEIFTPYATRKDLTKEDLSNVIAMFKKLDVSPDRIKEVEPNSAGISIRAPKNYVKAVNGFVLQMSRGKLPSLYYGDYQIYVRGEKVNDMNMVFMKQDLADEIEEHIKKRLKKSFSSYKDVKLLDWDYKSASAEQTTIGRKWYMVYGIEANVEYTKDVVGKSDEVKKTKVLYKWDDDDKELSVL